MNRNPFLIDEETLEEDDEIFELGLSAAEAPNWTPRAEDEVIVDKLLRETRYYREEIARLETLAKAEIDRIMAALASQTSRFRFSLARREASLKAFSEATDRARRVSPCGVLKWKKGSERVRFLSEDGEIIDDEARFIDALANEEPQLVKIESTVRKNEVKSLLKEGDAMVSKYAVMDRAPSKFEVEVPRT